MALPIAPTPILRGKDVDRFNKMVADGLKKGDTLPPLPNLDNAARKIKEYAAKQKQKVNHETT